MDSSRTDGDERSDAATAALEVVAERFADAAVVFLTGSVVRDEATTTSDLDLVVIYERLEAAYRESFMHDDWPVEAFVHDPETLRHFFERDRSRGVLAHMVAGGTPLPHETDLSRELKSLAAESIQAGPSLWSDAEIDASRYAITNLVDDLRAPRSRAELIATGTQLYAALGEHFLRTRGRWSALGKNFPRRLAADDPAFALRLADSFSLLFGSGRADAAIGLSEEVLRPNGGWLFAGYRALAPANWRIPGDGVEAPAAKEARVSFVVSLWIRGNDVAGFEDYECAAVRVMSKHDGRIDAVVRCDALDDGPFEVHVVSFPSTAAFDAYRNDPSLAALREARERVIARTEIRRGAQRTIIAR